MLDFKPLTLERREELLPYYHKFGGGSCQHSFVSSFCMAGKYGDLVCLEDGFLFTLRSLRCTERENIYLFPLGAPGNDDALRQALEKVLEHAHSQGRAAHFVTVTEEAAEAIARLLPGKFTLEERRDYAEYLYTFDKLANLPGHEMASKRHDISTFERDFGDRCEVRPITTQAQIDAIRPFQEWWLREKEHGEEDVQLELENEAIQIGLDHFFELGLSGIDVLIDGKLAGYAYGAPLSDTHYDVIIEKGDRRATDIYKILNRDLVRLCCQGMEYINREEDLGVEGLRTAKMSYKPDALIKKFIAREVEGFE